MLHPLHEALRLISRHRTELIALNVAFFGLFSATMVTTVLVPEIRPAVLNLLSGIVRADPTVQVYLTGNVLYAASATLAVNLTIATLLMSIPSFFVPFFGVAFAMVFAATYGVTLAPIDPYAATMIPHSITVLIEFGVYILAALGAYLTGRTVFIPAGKRRPIAQRYRMAAGNIPSLYTLVIPHLLLGAVYEAFEIIYLVRYFI